VGTIIFIFVHVQYLLVRARYGATDSPESASFWQCVQTQCSYSASSACGRLVPAITTSHSVSERESIVAICQAVGTVAAPVDPKGESLISGGIRPRITASQLCFLWFEDAKKS
jgi:hypothetical protein